MKMCGGTYILYSGKEVFWLEENGIEEETDHIWDGTLMILEWKIKKGLNVRKVYEQWPYPRGFDKNDFF